MRGNNGLAEDVPKGRTAVDLLPVGLNCRTSQADEYSHRTTGNVSRPFGRTARRHSAPAAARRAERKICFGRLVRCLVSQSRAVACNDETWARRRNASGVDSLQTEIPRRNESAGRSARPRTSFRAVASDELLRRLLLRKRSTLSPLDSARVAARERCGSESVDPSGCSWPPAEAGFL